ADLSVIEPEDLMEMGGLTEEDVNRIVDEAEKRAEAEERAVEEERKRQKEVRKTQGSKGGRSSDRLAKGAADSASQEGAVADLTDSSRDVGSAEVTDSREIVDLVGAKLSSTDLGQGINEQQNGGGQKTNDQAEAASQPVSSSTTTVSGEIVSDVLESDTASSTGPAMSDSVVESE
ncbi:MAG: hypothetical protein PHE53_07425, partial [Thermoguttaceae bacterium]|nr:hypothetical protein [Thermoguttaceae bacterium]